MDAKSVLHSETDMLGRTLIPLRTIESNLPTLQVGDLMEERGPQPARHAANHTGLAPEDSNRAVLLPHT